MSELLMRLIRSEKVSRNEINDLSIMKYNIDRWLDSGLITDDEYNQLEKE